MRTDKHQRHARFVQKIEEITKNKHSKERVLTDGYAWASLPQPRWAELLGVTPKTVCGLAKKRPIVAHKLMLPNRRVRVLYRTGNPPEIDLKHEANSLRKMFTANFNKDVTKNEWGCLYHFAKELPPGLASPIFKAVLNDWKMFMAGVKAFDPDSPHYVRYYEYPSIRVIRSHVRVAAYMYFILLQKKHEPVPKKLWKMVKDFEPQYDESKIQLPKLHQALIAENLPNP